MKKLMILVMVFSQLAGCASMNSSFDCPNKAGVTCKSLDQINGMVDTGQIHGRTSISDDSTTSLGFNGSAPGSEFQVFPTVAGYQPGEPIRYGETIQRIWIAPFEDNDGNYHQDSYMYTVMKNAHWIGHPVKSDTAF